ncbi:tyrosine-type recombinase/integrase [Sphingobium fuliginis]|uniref:Integrase n=2 Tax=Sphingobium TaxID=165695 RepID=A0ABQ1EWZ7_SPHSA|nr:site-specific integrase [Sphingobium fuliginis]RYL98662.1 site-specific integrase [Sphingobium fuliginis]GFZ89697.1 integrase [Sphingobium fuliginis]
MATGTINKATVDATHPGATDKMLWDDKIKGYGLKVTPAGAKIYLFQYRIGGRGAKTRRYTIGKHGALTPEKARREADRLHILIRQGIDPQAEKQDRQRKAVDLAFSDYADRFVEECLKVRWKRSHKDGESLLRLYAKPVLGSKPLPDITRADIRAVLAPARRKLATCRNLFAVLRRLFRWAVSEGDLHSSPLDGVEAPALPQKRDRFLSDDELRLVWLGTEKMEFPFASLFRLLIITGQRVEEVAGLEWSELDRSAAMWSLPAERAKNGEASQVPLSDLAMVELDSLSKGKKGKWPRSGLVFTTTGETPVSGFSRAKRRVDREAGALGAKEEEPIKIAPWRLHDLRRTLATGMQRLGVRFEVTEAILNHVSGAKSGVAGVYQRHDWGPEKRSALDAWAAHIAKLLTPTDKTNVVPLAAARA